MIEFVRSLWNAAYGQASVIDDFESATSHEPAMFVVTLRRGGTYRVTVEKYEVKP